MLRKWDSDLDAKLLFTILEACDIKTIPWPAITAGMGPGFTQEALRQRYKGLKRKAKSADSTDSNDTLSTSPAKSKTAGKQGAANSARSKKRTADTARAEEDAVEEDDAGPSTKKVKREGEGVNGEVFKVEAGEGGVNVEDDADLYDEI